MTTQPQADRGIADLHCASVRRAAARTLVLTALCAGCGTSGCASDGDGRTLPSLGQVHTARDSTPQGPVLQTGICRIDLPLDNSLEAAWALVDANAVPAGPRHWWQRNGLRVGVLGHPVRQRFMQSISSTYGWKKQVMIGGGEPVPVAVAPSNVSVTVQLPRAGNRPEALRLKGGRCQLLFRALELGGGRTAVELTPHHHLPLRQTFVVENQENDDATQRPRIRIRTSMDRARDGRYMDELTLSMELTHGQALVVGVDWPAAPESIKGDTERGTTDGRARGEAEAPTTGPRPDPPDERTAPPAPPVPHHLGRALLTAERASHPFQMLYLIECPTTSR